MANYPTQNEIRHWSNYAIDIFDSVMPSIGKSYPSIHIATAKTFPAMRTELVKQTGCTHTEESEAAIMEYIHGDKGYAILIRQNLLPDRDEDHFDSMLWHELGHFYAINTERTEFYHYSDPGIVDSSHIMELTEAGPILGMSDERLKQEGYWFWQEFIAESISKYVSYKNRSVRDSYQPELIDWKPMFWDGIVDKLLYLLNSTLYQYQHTIDEYGLAHYFANLLMDDFIKLYVQAAADGKLKVYDEEIGIVVYPDEPIEPTCISDIDSEEMQKPFWKMKQILEEQLAKEQFWLIDEQFLLDIGSCIGDMMFCKIIEHSRGF
jgi:hypothetical protein